MEEDILLDMYRGSWDAFLEAYKEKTVQNESLIKLVGDIIDIVDKEEDKRALRKQLGQILEA